MGTAADTRRGSIITPTGNGAAGNNRYGTTRIGLRCGLRIPNESGPITDGNDGATNTERLDTPNGSRGKVLLPPVKNDRDQSLLRLLC